MSESLGLYGIYARAAKPVEVPVQQSKGLLQKIKELVASLFEKIGSLFACGRGESVEEPIGDVHPQTRSAHGYEFFTIFQQG